MNWMDDGENRNSMKPIIFKPIEVEYNISLAEAIKLSVEKAGYKAHITKKDKNTSIYISDLPGNLLEVFVDINKYEYKVSTFLFFNLPNTVAEKLQCLEYANSHLDGVKIFYGEKDNSAFFLLTRDGSRLDVVDKLLENGTINIKLGMADVKGDEALIQEMLKSRERLNVYIEEDLEFNLSGKWNATNGYEYFYLIKDINQVINAAQTELEKNSLEF